MSCDAYLDHFFGEVFTRFDVSDGYQCLDKHTLPIMPTIYFFTEASFVLVHDQFFRLAKCVTTMLLINEDFT